MKLYHSNLINTITLTALLFAISSCCTKKYCVGADDIRQIEFLNFTDDEIDSVAILSYDKNSSFRSPLDSSVLVVYKQTSIIHLYLEKKLNINLDYKLNNLTTGQNYFISNFLTRKEECNQCFLRKDYYTQLVGYYVNGKTQNESTITIYK